MTSIIQFADIHFGVEDKEAVAAIAATVETLKPDVTVICGDITQNGKIDGRQKRIGPWVLLIWMSLTWL